MIILLFRVTVVRRLLVPPTTRRRLLLCSETAKLSLRRSQTSPRNCQFVAIMRGAITQCTHQGRVKTSGNISQGDVGCQPRKEYLKYWKSQFATSVSQSMMRLCCPQITCEWGALFRFASLQITVGAVRISLGHRPRGLRNEAASEARSIRAFVVYAR